MLCTPGSYSLFIFLNPTWTPDTMEPYLGPLSLVCSISILSPLTSRSSHMYHFYFSSSFFFDPWSFLASYSHHQSSLIPSLFLNPVLLFPLIFPYFYFPSSVFSWCSRSESLLVLPLLTILSLVCAHFYYLYKPCRIPDVTLTWIYLALLWNPCPWVSFTRSPRELLVPS